MTALPPLDVHEFAAFFRAIHGVEPFPWQERLANQVAAGSWPEVLDLPTGSGKTAALDVAVFVLALSAGRSSRQAPLRIVYVVDRRTIVDQAYERATKIRETIEQSDDDVVRRVRERLATYGFDGIPLRAALLRGGIARDDMWARSPDQPLIAVSTVDQVGSRLLFRGYGVSDLMKPVHAGLLGSDVLYLLDEVHLSHPFRETLNAISTRYRTWAERPLPAPFVVTEMSATPGARSGSTFRLDERDWNHFELKKRLRSSKPISLVSVKASAFTKEVEKHVATMLERPGATIAVVVNRVKLAREIHERLSANPAAVKASVDVHLLTGRMRPFDRDALEAGLRSRIGAGRDRHPDDRPTIVVSTQAIEAGADFDFDGLVTEAASLDALRQRFGRLDRLGRLEGSARGVIVARTDSFEGDPVYGNAIGATWKWLITNAKEGEIDFGLSALIVPEDADELLAPKASAPVLLPSHLDAWVQTCPIPEPDPDVSLWLHGPERGVADVHVVWRADLTDDLLAAAADSGKESVATEIAIAIVEVLPPVSAEAMPVPFAVAKRWLEGRTEADAFDVEGATNVDSDDREPRPESAPRAVVVWQGEQSRVVWPTDIRPGQMIVVPVSYGGIGNGNWNPASKEPVQDVAEVAAMRQGRRPTLRLHPAVVAGLFGAAVTPPVPPSSDVEDIDDRQLVLDWLMPSADQLRDEPLRSLVIALRNDRRSLRVERLRASTKEEVSEYFVAIGRRRKKGADRSVEGGLIPTDASDSSFTEVEVTLSSHVENVGRIAAGFAERLGVSASLKADLELTGQWHDAGKADPRFQRWLHGGSEFKALVHPEPLAKSAVRLPTRSARRQARERATYPEGTRHELMSLVLMEAGGEAVAARAEDWMLVQHLVASHHGHCRPFAPWVPDPNPIDVSFSVDGIAVRADSAHALARLDSGVAERFWLLTRRYGWWGLAWLEAIIRLADHRQSEREQLNGGARNA